MARAVAVTIPIALLMAGVQAALISGLRVLKANHVGWPMTAMAVLSAALLAAGVLQHYVDIWKHRTVRGISFIFVGIDAAGDLFSLVSIFFQPTLDVLGMVIYGTELVLWCGVFACGGYFNLLPWVRTQLSSRAAQGDPPSPVPMVVRADRDPGRQVALHDHPSSTSVFSTPPGAATGSRLRVTGAAERSGGGDREPAV